MTDHTPTPAPADGLCVHLRPGGCCAGPGYCAHDCGEQDDAPEPEPAHRATYSPHALHEGPRDRCRLCDIHEQPDDAAEPAPVTHPCRASGRDPQLSDLATRAAAANQRAADLDRLARQADIATAHEQALHEDHRRQLADALDVHPSRDWANLINTADDARRGRADAERRADRADRAADMLAGSHRRAEQAEAALARVREQVAEWHNWAGTESAIRDIERALSGEPGPQPQDPAALGNDQPTPDEPARCVCGDPIQRWTGPGEPGWIHSPGSDTTCTHARPRCTCAGVGFGNGDCAVHYPPKVEPEPEAPCFHPSWQTEPTVGARKCTDCGEWLDPQPPAPAELDGAALWAVIRDHAFNDTQWWRKVNQRRDHAQLNTYVQRGPGHTPTR